MSSFPSSGWRQIRLSRQTPIRSAFYDLAGHSPNGAFDRLGIHDVRLPGTYHREGPQSGFEMSNTSSMVIVLLTSTSNMG